MRRGWNHGTRHPGLAGRPRDVSAMKFCRCHIKHTQGQIKLNRCGMCGMPIYATRTEGRQP
jgi:hypothetical protein